MTMVRLVAVVALWASMLPAARAAPERGTVQDLLDAGQRAHTEGDYATALERFFDAYRRTEDRRLLYAVAVLQAKLGQLEEALASLDGFLTSDAPADRRADAVALARELRARLSRARITVLGLPAGAALTVDGVPYPAGPAGEIEVIPGRHVLAAQEQGAAPRSRLLDVAPGSDTTVSWESLVPEDGEADPARGAPAAPKAPEPGVDSSLSRPLPPARKSFSPWTWVTLGTGLALAAGGGLALGLGEADYRKVADANGYGDDTPIESMSRRRAIELQASGDRKVLAGYALVAVGGAALVSSLVLFVVEAVGVGAPHPAPSVTVAPGENAASVLVQGRF